MAVLADAVELFFAAITSAPIHWRLAERLATKIAAEGYGVDPGLEHLRNAVMRAFTPTLAELPQTLSDMKVALDEPFSKPSCALAAARIIRIFGDEFAVH